MEFDCRPSIKYAIAGSITNTDSEGRASSTDGAIAHRAVEDVRRLFGGRVAASDAIQGLLSYAKN